MTKLYLDDLEPGQVFVSGSHALDEEQIKAFAKMFDPQPFHLDGAAAERTLFGGGRQRVAYRCDHHAAQR